MSSAYTDISANDTPHRMVILGVPIFSSLTSLVMAMIYVCTDYPVELELIYTVLFSTLIFLIGCYLVLYHLRYEISKKYIDIYIGPILRKSIEIENIQEISFKRKTLAIYGNSYNTISLIMLDTKQINISPKDRMKFIEVLLNCNPSIKFISS